MINHMQPSNSELYNLFSDKPATPTSSVSDSMNTTFVSGLPAIENPRVLKAPPVVGYAWV